MLQQAEAMPIDLESVLEQGMLYPVFQPIVDFRIRGCLGYEALIRGPEGMLHLPNQLFAAARDLGLATQLEIAAREASLRAFAAQRLPGRLFLNVTPGTLLGEEWTNGQMRSFLAELGIAENRIVIELTENEKITSIPEIHRVLQYFRGRGFQIAIDDLGEGFANLRMWSEVRPEFVKIDRHFIDGIATDRMKFHFVKAMQDLAESCRSSLIAEGIECREDFDCVRSMNIACGQGYFIARPSTTPIGAIPAELLSQMLDSRVTLVSQAAGNMATRTARELLMPIAPVSADTCNEEVFARFEVDPTLDALPVVDGGQPLGMINRNNMINRYARAFRKELYGRRSCQQFMDSAPLIVDQNATIQELALMLSAAPKHHLLDGFIITGDGRYLGVGSSLDLVATITEMQISAARYANPLTQLPGNVPINEQVDRLLTGTTAFVVAYIDIDNFKPYNDCFGYRRGDDVILTLAQLLCDHVDGHLDFVGHIGGDDFFLIFQSVDWEQRCLSILESFTERIARMTSSDECPSGGYMAENRRGELVFQVLPTLSIGAVRIGPGEYESHREVAAAASEAKKQAKKGAKRDGCIAGQLFIERRRSSAMVSRSIN